MNEDILRTVIRDILIETRANLPIRPLIKTWWEVAAEFGIADTSNFHRQASDFYKRESWGDIAALQVPPQHKDKVFDRLTSETQEWVLKHWKSKEYFGNMIKGVTLVVVRQYPGSPTAIGRKSGSTEIDEGTYDEVNKTWVGGMSGYLSMKTQKYTWSGFKNLFKKKVLPTERHNTAEIDRELWKSEGLNDLKQADSVLVHEFQHWFQESVMYADARLKTPTPGTAKGTYKKPKTFKDKMYPIPPILKIILGQIVDGIDWQNPKTHPEVNLPMYEILDHQAMMDSIFAEARTYESIWPIRLYGTLRKPVSWLETFVEETMKIKLTDKGKESLAERFPLNKMRTEKWGLSKGDSNPIFDTQNMSEKQIAGIKDVITKADELIVPLLVPKSHIVKNTLQTTKDIKPNKMPITTTAKQLQKDPVYIMFVKHLSWREKSQNEFKKRASTSRGQHYFENLKNPISGYNKAWNERWVEFDAESRNYLSAVVMNLVTQNSEIWKASLKGDDEQVGNYIFTQLKSKLQRGNRIDRRIIKKNENELRTISERVADRIIEIVELYDPSWYRDPSNRPQGYDAMPAGLNDSLITKWVLGEGFINDRWWADYWRFIHDKIIGAV